MVKLVDKQVADGEALTGQERDAILVRAQAGKGDRRAATCSKKELVSTLTKEGKIKKYPEAIRRLGNSYKG